MIHVNEQRRTKKHDLRGLFSLIVSLYTTLDARLGLPRLPLFSGETSQSVSYRVRGALCHSGMRRHIWHALVRAALSLEQSSAVLSSVRLPLFARCAGCTRRRQMVKVLRHLQGQFRKILLRVSSCPSFALWQKSHDENNIHSTGT